VAGFDPPSYEDQMLKPLRRQLPHLPDDLLTRYAVELTIDPTALSRTARWPVLQDNYGKSTAADLGTTYSAIAYIDETGRPTVCRNDNNSEITPSVVQFERPTNVVVGESTEQSAFIDAGSVVSLIKRQMDEDREYEFHGEVHTPESISALILRRCAR